MTGLTPEQVKVHLNCSGVKAEVKELGLARNPQQWTAFKKKVIGRDLPDTKLTAGHISKLTSAIAQHKSSQAA